VHAVLTDRVSRIEALRSAIIADMPKPLSAADAIVALVRPLAEHMRTHGVASHHFRFIEQATRHFGLARVAEEAQAAASLAACMAALTGHDPHDRRWAARAYLVVGMIYRGFADREQARAEGVLVLEDDDVFADLLIDTAHAAVA
jgi:hypothetical protein